MNPLRSVILVAAGNDALRRALTAGPGTRGVVERFVAGETVADAATTAARLIDNGLHVTLDYLGEDTGEPGQAEAGVQTYLSLLRRLGEEGLSSRAEVSVKLSAVGLLLDEKFALDNVRRICAAAEGAGTTVTLDMEDHRSTESTLRVLAELRCTWPWVGAVLQSYLRRTEADVVELAVADSRVRLCKGAYAEPEEFAFTAKHDVDLGYVRCANVLLAGAGYPMFATHDPRLIAVLGERARWYGRKPGGYEYQMLFGVRPDEQRRLAAEGETVRVYVPFGERWYGYLVRRLAERPANLAFFLRALVSHS